MREHVVRAGVLVLALAVSGCVTAQSAPPPTQNGEWIYSRAADPVTGAPHAQVWLVTRRASPPRGEMFPRPVSLQLQCFKGEPIAELVFAFPVGSNRSASLGYRFDDKPGRDVEARFLQDRKRVVIEDRAALTGFADELRNASRLLVRVNSLVLGQTTAEFAVHGAERAMAAAYADCPLAPPPRRRTS